MQRVAPADGSDSFVLDVAGSFSAKSTDKMNKLHQNHCQYQPTVGLNPIKSLKCVSYILHFPPRLHQMCSKTDIIVTQTDLDFALAVPEQTQPINFNSFL